MIVVSLTMHVDGQILCRVLEEAMNRFPQMNLRLVEDGDSLVFSPAVIPPEVFREGIDVPESFADERLAGSLMCVSVCHKTIYFRYHRALADEHGILSFIKAVIMRYLETCGLATENDGTVKLLSGSYFKAEGEDPMGKLDDIPASRPVWYMDAKAFVPEISRDDIDTVIQIRVPLPKNDRLQEDNLSRIPVTYIAPLFSHALYEVTGNGMESGEYIVAGININLRPYFPTASMRPFHTPVYLAYNRKIGEYPYQTVLMSQKKLLEAQLKTDALAYSAKRKIADVEKACNGTLGQKRHAFRTLGEKMNAMSTYTVSRIGNLILPEKMQRYVTELYPVLPSSGQTCAMTIVNFRGEMFITVSGGEVLEKVCGRFIELMHENGIASFIADKYSFRPVRL